MADINSILNYPDVSFINNTTQEQLESSSGLKKSGKR